MADVEYTGDTLVVHVKGWDKIWALKSRLEIPREHVIGAGPVGEEARQWKGWRMPGTQIPGVMTASTFIKEGGRVFWDLHDADRAIAIRLRDDQYRELIVEVADPTATIDLINRIAQR